jgi:hypothetical protein
MVDKDELIARSRKSGKKIHVGNLMTICSIKFHEMAQEYWKYKGRIVFRGDDVKDEYGAPAVFQNLSASPTGVHTTNSTIVWGSLPGHSVQVSNAIRAYIQSTLNSQHETWVLIPPELRPKHWAARRPMCRLVKALYGHPESGGHWEAEKAVQKIGGISIPNHPSSFFFPASRMLLTVYVDDLLLAGPDGGHAAIWLEDPEPLDRFLGRSHRTVTAATNDS